MAVGVLPLSFHRDQASLNPCAQGYDSVMLSGMVVGLFTETFVR